MHVVYLMFWTVVSVTGHQFSEYATCLECIYEVIPVFERYADPQGFRALTYIIIATLSG
jgi:hypothetical protein